MKRYEDIDDVRYDLFPRVYQTPPKCFEAATVPENLRGVKDKMGILLGPSGTGKSWAMWGIINAYRSIDPPPKVCAVWLILERDLMTWMYDGLVLDAICRYPYKLIIDDLGYECHGDREPHPWLNQCAYAISDHRSTHQHPTIYTSNLSEERLRIAYGAATASRILSGFVVDTEGRDRRMQTGEEL